MAPAKFAIPEEYKDQLRYVEAQVEGSDEEILRSLETHRPVTSEKNIWGFWDKGIRQMPAWCQRNVINWVRLCGPSWTVIVLDDVHDSSNYALKYVTPDLMPAAFVDGRMDGPYTATHSADFMRGACLYLHGGVSIDVGIILIRKLDDICWKQLEDPNSPYEVSIPLMYDTFTANHWVASRKGNKFIKHWHDIWISLWKGKTNNKGIFEDPRVAFARELDFTDVKQGNYAWNFSADPIFVFEYIGQVISWQRLCMLEDAGDGFNGWKYWQENVLCFDALQENWAAEPVVGFEGSDLYNALATKLDADPKKRTGQEGPRDGMASAD